MHSDSVDDSGIPQRGRGKGLGSSGDSSQVNYYLVSGGEP